jgi:hypothetical protein
MMKKINKRLIKEINNVNINVSAIPITDETRKKVLNLGEAMIKAITIGELQPENEIEISGVITDIILDVFDSIPGSEDLPVFGIGIAINFAVDATLEAIALFIHELRKNKVLFDNRQVLVNASHGEMMNDNRQFMILGIKNSLVHDDISAYTDDPKILNAYKQFIKKIKRFC